jgi:hypothetical protein
MTSPLEQRSGPRCAAIGRALEHLKHPPAHHGARGDGRKIGRAETVWITAPRWVSPHLNLGSSPDAHAVPFTDP